MSVHCRVALECCRVVLQRARKYHLHLQATEGAAAKTSNGAGSGPLEPPTPPGQYPHPIPHPPSYLRSPTSEPPSFRRHRSRHSVSTVANHKLLPSTRLSSSLLANIPQLQQARKNEARAAFRRKHPAPPLFCLFSKSPVATIPPQHQAGSQAGGGGGSGGGDGGSHEAAAHASLAAALSPVRTKSKRRGSRSSDSSIPTVVREGLLNGKKSMASSLLGSPSTTRVPVWTGQTRVSPGPVRWEIARLVATHMPLELKASFLRMLA